MTKRPDVPIVWTKPRKADREWYINMKRPHERHTLILRPWTGGISLLGELELGYSFADLLEGERRLREAAQKGGNP